LNDLCILHIKNREALYRIHRLVFLRHRSILTVSSELNLSRYRQCRFSCLQTVQTEAAIFISSESYYEIYARRDGFFGDFKLLPTIQTFCGLHVKCLLLVQFYRPFIPYYKFLVTNFTNIRPPGTELIDVDNQTCRR